MQTIYTPLATYSKKLEEVRCLRQEARRLLEEAQVVSNRLLEEQRKLAAEIHKTFSYTQEASRLSRLARQPLLEKPRSKRFVLQEHCLDGQRFTWSVDIRRSDASCQAVFLIDEQEVSDKQQWLSQLEQARQTAHLQHELSLRDVVMTQPSMF